MYMTGGGPFYKTTSPSHGHSGVQQSGAAAVPAVGGGLRLCGGADGAAEPGGTLSGVAPAVGALCRRSSTVPAATMPGRRRSSSAVQEQHYLCDPHGGGVVGGRAGAAGGRGLRWWCFHGITPQVPRRRYWGAGGRLRRRRVRHDGQAHRLTGTEVPGNLAGLQGPDGAPSGTSSTRSRCWTMCWQRS